MISSQENDGKQEENPELVKEADDKIDDIKAKEDLENEENEKDFVEGCHGRDYQFEKEKQGT